MADTSKAGTSDNEKAETAAKRAIEDWERDGARDDQDYFHIPGSPKVDRQEIDESSRGQKPRKS